MLDWMRENSGPLNVFANFGMLLIWLVYLQLFLMSYRRQRKAKIIVNRGVGTGTDAHCLISNMSAEAVYMQSILVTVTTEAGEWTAPVASADEQELAGRPGDSPGRREERQGPLLPGTYVDLGPFEKLMHQAAGRALGQERSLPDVEAICSVEITVIAIYGSEDSLIGARRTFDIVDEGVTRRLRPQSVASEQLGGRRGGRLLKRLMRETYTR